MNADAQKLITCILPKGVAAGVLKVLKDEWDIVTANINSARGIGKITPLKYRGLGDQAEKEILTLMVPAGRADEVFDFIYFEADINRPHGGLMYMLALQTATAFRLPDLPAEK
jgi:hypothetical protein